MYSSKALMGPKPQEAVGGMGYKVTNGVCALLKINKITIFITMDKNRTCTKQKQKVCPFSHKKIKSAYMRHFLTVHSCQRP